MPGSTDTSGEAAASSGLQLKSVMDFTGPSFDVVSPIDGSVAATVPDVQPKAAESMADAVIGAFPAWRDKAVRERADILLRWADLIDEAVAELAPLIVAEMGKPIREAHDEIAYASGFARTHAHDALRADGHLMAGRGPNHRVEVSYKAIGPVIGITPWNFPAAMVTRTAAPALAAGCTIVLKPAEQTPATALVLEKLWRRAGGDEDAFRVLTCEKPREIIRRIVTTKDFRKLTFTGSHAVGVELYQLAAGRMMRVSMELGGHAPFLVMADADIDAAAREIMRSKFRISGQTCVCVNRVLVHSSIAGRLVEALERLMADLVTGDPREIETDVGPLVNRAGYDKVADHVAQAVEAGARIRIGGQPGRELTFAPTLLVDVADSMRVMREETFGPVLPVATFETEQEAVERANSSPFGLAAYLWTRDLACAHRVSEALEAGIVGINDGIPGGDPGVPFGGVKGSGVGRAGGRWGLHAYLEPQYRSIQLPVD